MLNPNRPLPIADAKPLVVPIHLGERMPRRRAVPKVKLCLLIPRAARGSVSSARSARPAGGWLVGVWVPVSAIKEGANAVEIALAAPRDTDATEPGWDVVWTATRADRPWAQTASAATRR